MAKRKLKVSVVGCSLADQLYTNINFDADGFARYRSQIDGDGGLMPGRLVLADALEKFSGEEYPAILAAITGGAPPAARNLGGPAVVAAIGAAQLLHDDSAEFYFYGACGDDETARFIRGMVERTGVLNIDNYKSIHGSSPATDVFSDPAFHDGKGERTFVNNIGAAHDYGADDLPESFFDADICVFGATALLPRLHGELTGLLRRAKEKGCATIVTTVFDFPNESRDRTKRWPLGESDASYSYIDVLVMDWDEARRLSGHEKLEEMSAFFMGKGVKSFVITHGAKSFYVASEGSFFAVEELRSLGVCTHIDDDLARNPELRGDTTGCGDNFAGGVIYAVIKELAAGKEPGSLDLLEAAAWATAAGGFACFSIGGTYVEKYRGEKREKVAAYVEKYKGTL